MYEENVDENAYLKVLLWMEFACLHGLIVLQKYLHFQQTNFVRLG